LVAKRLRQAEREKAGADMAHTLPITLEIRDVGRGDAAQLADLLNALIAQGGTTALEQPYTPEGLAEAYLVGPDVLCCFVAVDPASGRLEGFQTLGRYAELPDDVGDIGTFARIDGKQRGVGSALFSATRERARQLGLAAINATIRADNAGGLAFYGKMGFEDHSVTRDVPLKDGRLVDRVNRRFSLA
jgi:L-amino acid N-acyltransferase YncA